MARDSSTVKVSFLGDASQLAREAKRADASMDAVGRRASDMGKRMGSAFAVGAGAAATGAVLLAKSAISAASDMAEAVSKNQQVFGASAASVRAWAEDSEKNLLLTKQAAIEAAATFGNLFVSIGVQGPKAADMSTALVGLAEDLSSFNNVTVDDALTALRSGLLGEVAPMRRFGVALSEARLQAEAYATGIAKPVKDQGKIVAANNAVAAATAKLAEIQKLHGKGTLAEAQAQDKVTAASKALESAMAGQKTTLTATEKSAAAYSIIMKDTAVAQGDAARTQDGLANQSRILTKQIGDLQAEIGAKLLPHVLTAVHYINDLITGFQNGTGHGGQLRDALGQVADAAQAVGDALIPVLGWMVDHPDEMLGMASAILAVKGAMLLAQAQAALLGPSLVAVGAGGTAAGAGLTAAMGPIGLFIGALVYLNQTSETVHDSLASIAQGIAELDFGKFIGWSDRPDGKPGLGTPTPWSDGKQGGGGTWANPGFDATEGRRDLAQANRAAAAAEAAVVREAEQIAKQAAGVQQKAKFAADQAEANRKRQADAKAAADKRESDRLAAIAKAREAIAARIETATQKVRDALQARQDLSNRVRDNLMSNASIVQGGMSWTASDLAAAFKKKLAEVKRFQLAVSTMVHKGFDATIIQQVAEGGVANMQTAIGLAGAQSSQVKEINATQGAINKAAGLTGDRTAKGVLGNITIPIDVYLDGKKLAPDLARAVNDWNRRGTTNGARAGRAT